TYISRIPTSRDPTTIQVRDSQPAAKMLRNHVIPRRLKRGKTFPQRKFNVGHIESSKEIRGVDHFKQRKLNNLEWYRR
ncbi:MAG: hypothetical protein AB2693_32830, partial [Candidatus Thiodiazotropha sp.]